MVDGNDGVNHCTKKSERFRVVYTLAQTLTLLLIICVVVSELLKRHEPQFLHL